MDISIILTQLFLGLMLGMLYALISSGLSLIFGLLDVVNFAHGAFYAMGAYIGLTVINLIGNFWLALIIAPLALMGLGSFIEITALRRIYGVTERSLLMLFGVSLVLIQVIRFTWGVASLPLGPPDLFSKAVRLGTLSISSYRLFLFGVCATLVTIVWIVLTRTTIGVIIRAGLDNKQMVKSMGIDISKYFNFVFALGAGLAGLAGILAAPLTGLQPRMGISILVLSFVVVVIGGMGSFRGSIISGILVGETIAITSLIYPEMSDAVIFLLMGLFLLIKPEGLLGRKL